MDREPRPFIVYAIGRCRSAWLASFLSFGGWKCHHEQAIHMRSMDDVRALFGRPCTGTVETAAAPGWPLLKHHVPKLRQVVVRRPVDDVVRSMMSVDLGGAFTYDEEALRRGVTYLARVLDRIAAQPGTLVVDYNDLDDEDACRAVFEHCLPLAMPLWWFYRLRDQNIECNVRGILAYYQENREAVEGFKSLCRRELRALARAGVPLRKAA